VIIENQFLKSSGFYGFLFLLFSVFSSEDDHYSTLHEILVDECWKSEIEPGVEVLKGETIFNR
jgi:hypothetical protein